MPNILAILTHERDKLNRAIEALGDNVGHAVISLTKKTERKVISAESRAKMAAGQKARWAKAKVETDLVNPVKQFTMSAASKAKIAAAQKARWVKTKAGQ
jgi:hypothetical protein